MLLIRNQNISQIFILIILLFPFQAKSQDNLNTCLSGKYPSLCDYTKLTPAQKKEVLNAEKRENLATCLTGKYKSLCKYSLLSDSELSNVRLAEKRENLAICLTGKYRSLCDYSLLNSTQEKEVERAETKENLKVCLDGRYSALCDYSKLTQEQRAQVLEAEKSAPISTPNISSSRQVTSCEEGHWIKSVTQGGEIIILEDGSVWEIDSIDTIYTTLWLPVTEIVACPYQLINTDDGEKAGARKIN